MLIPALNSKKPTNSSLLCPSSQHGSSLLAMYKSSHRHHLACVSMFPLLCAAGLVVTSSTGRGCRSCPHPARHMLHDGLPCCCECRAVIRPRVHQVKVVCACAVQLCGGRTRMEQRCTCQHTGVSTTNTKQRQACCIQGRVSSILCCVSQREETRHIPLAINILPCPTKRHARTVRNEHCNDAV